MRTRFYTFEPTPFHLVCRRQGSLSWDQPMPVVWRLLIEKLAAGCSNGTLTTHAFVLMRNHFHLLGSSTRFPPHSAAAEILGRETLDDQIFQIENFYQYHQVYKYIYRNPVDAGITINVEDYRYSTLKIVLGEEHSKLIVEDPFNVIFDQVRMLDWLNTPDDYKKVLST